MKNILRNANFGFKNRIMRMALLRSEPRKLNRSFGGLRASLLLALTAGWMGAAQAQQLVTNPSGVTQSFDTIGTSATATLPTGWKIGTDWSTGTGATTVAAGTSGTGVLTGTSTGGAYNFANGITASATDRCVGFLSGGSYSSPRSLIYAFQNNTGATITSLTVSWDFEKYRSGSRAFDWTFFHGPSATADISNSNGNQSYTADAGNTTINNPPTSISKNITITGLSIAPGTTYYFRWTYTGLAGSTNGQGLGIDNFVMTATVAANATPPSLTPANSAKVDASFDVAFTDDSAWRNAISSITVGGSTLPNAAYTKTVAGKITFNPSQSTLLQSVGSKTIVVKASGYSDATVTQSIFSGAATQIAITTQPTAPSFNGGTLAAQAVVTLRDQYGNTSTSTDNVTVIQGGGGSWALSGGLSVAAANGVATFTGLTAGHSTALSGVTLSFSSGILEPVSSNPFNIPAPVAPTLAAASSATVDGPFTITFADNSAWRAAITAVRVASTTLDSSVYVVSEGQITLTPSASILLQTSGDKSFSVVAGGYANAMVTQTLGAGVATKLVLTTQPVAPATNGGALATQPIVKFADQYDNLTTSGTGDVTAVADGGGFTLGGNGTVTPATGVAIFTDLTAGAATALSGVTISFSSGSLTGISSSGFNIPAPLAPALAAAVSATADADFVVTYPSNSNWQNAITGITVGGQALDPAAYFVADGQITFKPSASTLLQSADSKTIAVNATGYSATTVLQSLGAGVATKLAVTTQPTAPATNGGVLAAQPVVRFQDQYNNNTSGTAEVTATPANGGTWTLGGTTTVAPASNIATFVGLTAANSASALTGVAIQFSAVGVQSTTSNTFDIPAPPPANDLADNAITLPLDGTAVSGTMVQATVSAPFAGATGTSINVPDVWYKFTPTQNGAIFIQANTVSSTLDLFVWVNSNPTATTGSLTPAGGSAVPSTTVKKTTIFVEASKTYFLRVALNSAANTAQAFTLSANPNYSPRLLAWDFTGEGTVSTVTSGADAIDLNLDSSPTLSRGTGAAWSTAGNSFRSQGFQNNGIGTANTDYFQFEVSAASGRKLSLQNLVIKVNGTAAFMNSPGVQMQFAYSLDGTTFNLIGSSLSTMDTGVPTIDLSSISDLQNVPANTTVTFRYYASGQTTTGGWGFNSPAAGQYGLYVTGTTSVPNSAPTDIGLTATSIAENNAVDAVVGTFSTTDVDSGDIFTYSLVAGEKDVDNASFNISGNSLRTSARFDFETKSSYNVRVRATDSANNTFEKAFTIRVEDLPEALTYSSWLGVLTPSDAAFLDYVFGAVTPGTLDPSLKPTVAVTGGNLVLTYYVRQGTAGLTVTPKTSADLAAAPGDWVNVIPVDVDVAREVNGIFVQQKTASVPVSGDRKFLKLEVLQE